MRGSGSAAVDWDMDAPEEDDRSYRIKDTAMDTFHEAQRLRDLRRSADPRRLPCKFRERKSWASHFKIDAWAKEEADRRDLVNKLWQMEPDELVAEMARRGLTGRFREMLARRGLKGLL